ncbi:MAG TPA: sucrase ferredoxin [Acidimicrobiales bacterium]|jgi:(2Fe-2S) ferredoxin
MAEPLALRCADESLARGEPMVGTASRVQRWMVIEQAGAWGSDALIESRLDRSVAAALDAGARRHRVRVLLARRTADRRPGEPPDQTVRRVFLAHSGIERWWLEQLDLPTAEPGRLLDIDLGTLAFPDPPGIGRPGPPSLHLVCTNGRHDPCCADLGRPVVRALTAAGAPEVWESSHVGGDRFAANIVCLPEGVYYGRVEPELAAALVAEHRAGRIDLDHYRGRSCLPPLVQAADLFARHQLGEVRIDGLTVLSTEARADGTVAVLVQQRGGDAVEVVVRREQVPTAVQLTCHVHELRRPWAFRRVEVRPA